MTNHPRPILVTGAHRSGTGWLGSMIAASPSPPVAYLWEPFSILHRPGICDARFETWFPYVCPANGSTYLDPIADMLAFRYKTMAELRSVRSLKDAVRLLRDRRDFRRYRRRGARPLLKDPIAVFSAEWLCDSFGMDALVLIRHPAAFANSITSRRLRHPFGDFLAQPLLMRDLLGSFEDQIRRFAAEEQPLLDQAILLWRIIHHVILTYRDRRPEWMFLRLEDIARDPLARFQEIYARLGQVFDEEVAAVIDEHSGASNPAESMDPADHHRNSGKSVTTWKAHLSGDEVRRIREEVEPISKEFYTDVDW
jgi:hypothetical protein